VSRRGGDVRAAAAAELEGSGFGSRADLNAWLELCGWLDDPGADPDLYSWIGGCGWVRTDAVEIKRRSRAVAPLQSSAPRFLTLREAGALVRAAPETIRYWIWQGRLQAYKPGGAVLVREDELLALVESREACKLRASSTLSTRRVLNGRRVDSRATQR
jgi:excisionase family DNA binding protein